MRSAIDTNVISALWSSEPLSLEMASLLGNAREDGGLVVCAAVYAELLAHPKASPAFVNSFLDQTGIVVDFQITEPAWRSAAAQFSEYAVRRRESQCGHPKRLLVDFLIGAHAQSIADRLLTLDPVRYRGTFPKLRIEP